VSTISIIGLGLIGTSLGLAIKQSKLEGLRLVGHDKEPTHSREAQKMGAVDQVEWNLLRAVKEADMVVIATPVLAIKEVMEQIAPALEQECVVTDTGSTKAQVLEWAAATLPKRASFVGGHPMAGKEESGPAAADAALFKDATYCIIPDPKAAPWAVQSVVTLVEAIGAKPFFMDAAEHDSFVAAVSHLPLAVSAALVASTTKSPAWHEMARLAASGYRDVTRLASGDPTMSRDICMTNAAEVAGWVDRLIESLLELRKNLQQKNEEGVARFFANSHEEREKWVAGVPLGPSAAGAVEIPKASEQLTQMFVGELLAKKSRALLAQYEKDGSKKRGGR
jgi:prephenate dehydrogenase